MFASSTKSELITRIQYLEKLLKKNNIKFGDFDDCYKPGYSFFNEELAEQDDV